MQTRKAVGTPPRCSLLPGKGTILWCWSCLRPGQTLTHATGTDGLHSSGRRGGNLAGTAQILIGHGADVNQLTSSNYTALMSAARWGCVDVVPVLLSAGADVNVRGRDGRTALAWAKESKAKTIVDALVKAGAK